MRCSGTQKDHFRFQFVDHLQMCFLEFIHGPGWPGRNDALRRNQYRTAVGFIPDQDPMLVQRPDIVVITGSVMAEIDHVQAPGNSMTGCCLLRRK